MRALSIADIPMINESSFASTSPADNERTPLAGSKWRASALGEDIDEKSESAPIIPDYSIGKSSGDSVASGDDSGQWEAERERILAMHTAQNDDEEAAMANNVSVNNIAELPEFMLEGADLNAPITNNSAVLLCGRTSNLDIKQQN
jgi:hypothetical protein